MQFRAWGIADREGFGGFRVNFTGQMVGSLTFGPFLGIVVFRGRSSSQIGQPSFRKQVETGALTGRFRNDGSVLDVLSTSLHIITGMFKNYLYICIYTHRA